MGKTRQKDLLSSFFLSRVVVVILVCEDRCDRGGVLGAVELVVESVDESPLEQ